MRLALPRLLQNPPRPYLWALALSGAVIAASATRVIDFDIWWHLRSGELIWRWGQIPRFDVFSYTAAGAPWVDHEWLYQLIVWSLTEAFGFFPLTLVKLAVAGLIAAAFFRTERTLGSSISVAAYGLIALIIAMADRITDRPHIFTMLAIAFFCLELHAFAAGRRKALWHLPIVQVLWINLHGGGTLGPQLMFAFALGESLQLFFGGRCLDRGRLRHLWLMAGATLAACCLNPYGIEALIFPLAHAKMHAILTYTQEWLPPLDPRLDPVVSQIAFRIVLILTLASYICARRRARFSHLALTVLSSVLVLQGRRFTADFCLINLPLILANFAAPNLTAEGPLPRPAGNLLGWANFAIVLGLSALLLARGVPATLRGGTSGELGWGASPQFAPARMVDFIEAEGISGRVFNEMGLGGYLIYRLWPGQRVFLDGRTPVYGDEFYRAYVEAFQLSRNFEELDRRWSFDYLAFKADSVANIRDLHRYLWEGKRWRLVFADPAEGFVYVRDAPKFRDLIRRHAFKRHPLFDAGKKAQVAKVWAP